MIKKKKEGMKMTYKVTFHTIDGKAIVVDDVEAENQNEAWQEASRTRSGKLYYLRCE